MLPNSWSLMYPKSWWIRVWTVKTEDQKALQELDREIPFKSKKRPRLRLLVWLLQLPVMRTSLKKKENLHWLKSRPKWQFAKEWALLEIITDRDGDDKEVDRVKPVKLLPLVALIMSSKMGLPLEGLQEETVVVAPGSLVVVLKSRINLTAIRLLLSSAVVRREQSPLTQP